jgi:hypothetical protein
MPKPLKNKARALDVNELAFDLVRRTSEDSPALNLSKYMAEIGRKGGRIGGKKRLETMSASARKRVATKAAKARWAKAKTRQK